LKIHCLGGLQEVGRNAVLIETKSEKILLDSGLKVETNEAPLLPSGKLDAIFITHGHLDHLGTAPISVRTGKCKIYGTAPTHDQSILLLKDSLKVARLRGFKPKFTDKDIAMVDKSWVEIKYRQKIKIGRATVEVFDAGHIPGSCSFVVNCEGKRILYTGDLKLDQTILMNGANLADLGKIDLALMETTYSSKEQEPRHIIEKELYNLAKESVDKKGIALIPSFALRAAEVIMILDKFKPREE